jgi:hypothetical protein
VGGFEIRSFLCTFNWLLAFNELKRILLVGREFVQSLVVTSFRRVRRLEGLIVKWLMRLDVLLGVNLLNLLWQGHV